MTTTPIESNPSEWWGELPPEEPDLGPASVGFVADFYNRYPGEAVTFFVRVDIRERLDDLSLRIELPKALLIEHYQSLFETGNGLPHVGLTERQFLVWSLPGRVQAGDQFEYQIQAKVGPTLRDLELEGSARLLTADQTVIAAEGVTLAVQAKGRYLQYLPALYENDALMGRFLMLFESFWAPLQQQIGHTHDYLDPRLTPSEFLPWLASWLDLELDEQWSEAQLRQLIRWAIALHRSRGTKWGLLKYLEIYTGQRAEIVEQRANNFVIGPEARLGPGIALGQGNIPHTFTVALRLPEIEAEDEVEQRRRESLRRRGIEAIIEMQKPAHTVYALRLESLAADEVAERIENKEAMAGDEDEVAAQASIWFNLED